MTFYFFCAEKIFIEKSNINLNKKTNIYFSTKDFKNVQNIIKKVAFQESFYLLFLFPFLKIIQFIVFYQIEESLREIARSKPVLSMKLLKIIYKKNFENIFLVWKIMNF